jgi:RimJ/RimL family protein N-acetyltransferase
MMETNMEIAKASMEDMDVLLAMYAFAREFMRSTGNVTQWEETYPPESLLVESIEQGKQYVCLREQEIVGTFYFGVEEEVTYQRIVDGHWLNDRPYGVVHRLASNGKARGVARFCLAWCFEQCPNIRVDTHRDNRVMQKILEQAGYHYCGIIYVRNGTERLAFQKQV